MSDDELTASIERIVHQVRRDTLEVLADAVGALGDTRMSGTELAAAVREINTTLDKES